MWRVKSVSAEGTYFLVNGWKKHHAFWVRESDPRYRKCAFFKDKKTAKMCLTKLLKIMDDYKDDEITFEYVGSDMFWNY